MEFTLTPGTDIFKISAAALANALTGRMLIKFPPSHNLRPIRVADYSEYKAIVSLMSKWGSGKHFAGIPIIYYMEYFVSSDEFTFHIWPASDHPCTLIVEELVGTNWRTPQASYSSAAQGPGSGAGAAYGAQQAASAQQTFNPFTYAPCQGAQQNWPSDYRLPATHRPLPSSLVIGEIIAWRIWLIKGNFLFSPHYDDEPWAYSEPYAAEGKVEDYNHNGLYSFKTEREAIKHAYEYNFLTSHVCGQVAIWGTVIEHTRGYRSEFAKPVSLITLLGRRAPTALDSLRTAYGCSKDKILPSGNKNEDG